MPTTASYLNEVKTDDVVTDVVTVPDFTKPSNYASFTARTLLFLASWESKAKLAQSKWRVHVACIGEPPIVVRTLAEEVGAVIHIFSPLSIGRSKFANKLRGLEIPPHLRAGKRVLLLDTDTLFLNDPIPFARTVPVNAISAAPSGYFPEPHWRRIYHVLNLPDPPELVPHFRIQLGLQDIEPVKERGIIKTNAHAVRPYHNGGVIMCPWDAPLRQCWAEHLLAISTHFPPPRNVWEKAILWLRDPVRVKPLYAVSRSDQAALATAIQALQLQGWSFFPLPNELNARQDVFESGLIKWDEAAIWHAIKLGRHVETWEQVAPHLKKYCADYQTWLDQGAQRRGEDVPLSTPVCEFVEELWQNRVSPLVTLQPI